MSGSEPFARIENRKNIGSFLAILKPNYFKKQRSLLSFLLTYGINTGSKWQWSAQ